MANAFTYIANIGKSVGYSTVDRVREMNPALADFADQNADLGKVLYESVKDFKGTAKKVRQFIIDSPVGEFAIEYKKAFFEDIKTGKFYNRERIDQMNLRAAGDIANADLGDDAWDNLDEELGISSGSSKKSSSSSSLDVISSDDAEMMDTVDKVGGKVTMGVASATARSAEYQVEAYKAGVSAQQKHLSFVADKINAGMAGMNSTIAQLVEFNDKAMIKHIDNSAKFYTEITEISRSNNKLLKKLVDMQEKQYANQEEKKGSSTKSMSFSDITSGGMPNLKAYGKQLIQNANSASEGLLDLNSAMGEGSNFLVSFAGAPLKGITDMVAKQIIPNMLAKSMEQFNNSLSGLFAGLMLRANEMRNGTGRFEDMANPFFEKLGEILGIQSNLKTSIKAGTYNRGPVPFDGESKMALTRVIPDYLAKILAATTGTSEKLFDYESGSYKELTELKKSIDNNTRDYSDKAAAGIISELKDMIEENIDFTGNMKKYEELMEDMHRMFETSFVNGQVLDFRKGIGKKGNIYETARQLGIDPNNAAILIPALEHLTTPSSGKKGDTTLGGRGRQDLMMEYNKNIFEQREAMTKMMKYMEDNASSLAKNLFNGFTPDEFVTMLKGDDGEYYSPSDIHSIKDTKKLKNPNLMNNIYLVKDERGHNVFWYLQEQLLRLDYMTKNPVGNGAPVQGPPAPSNHQHTITFDRNAVLGDESKKSDTDVRSQQYKKKQEQFDRQQQKKVEDRKKLFKEGKAGAQLMSMNEIFDKEELRDGSNSFIGNVRSNEQYQKRKEIIKNAKDRKKKSTLMQMILESENIDDRFKQIVTGVDELAHKPAKFLASVIGKADQRLFEIIYGDQDDDKLSPKSFMGQLTARLTATFANFSDWLKDEIFTPLKETLFGDDGLGLAKKLKEFTGSESFGEFLHKMFDDKLNYIKNAYSEVLNSILPDEKMSAEDYLLSEEERRNRVLLKYGEDSEELKMFDKSVKHNASQVDRKLQSIEERKNYGSQLINDYEEEIRKARRAGDHEKVMYLRSLKRQDNRASFFLDAGDDVISNSLYDRVANTKEGIAMKANREFSRINNRAQDSQSIIDKYKDVDYETLTSDEKQEFNNAKNYLKTNASRLDRARNRAENATNRAVRDARHDTIRGLEIKSMEEKGIETGKEIGEAYTNLNKIKKITAELREEADQSFAELDELDAKLQAVINSSDASEIEKENAKKELKKNKIRRGEKYNESYAQYDNAIIDTILAGVMGGGKNGHWTLQDLRNKGFARVIASGRLQNLIDTRADKMYSELMERVASGEDAADLTSKYDIFSQFQDIIKNYAGRLNIDANDSEAPIEITGRYARGGMVNKTGIATVSEGELIIPSEYNPFYKGSNNKMSQIEKENQARKNFTSFINSIRGFKPSVRIGGFEDGGQPVPDGEGGTSNGREGETESDNKKEEGSKDDEGEPPEGYFAGLRRINKQHKDARKATKEDIDNIKERIINGERLEDIAKEYNVSPADLRFIINNDKLGHKIGEATSSMIDSIKGIGNKLGIGQSIKDIAEALTGVKHEVESTDDDKKKLWNAATEDIKKNKGDYIPSALGGAVAGGGISLITGAIGGPLLGAAVGAATDLVVKSGKVQDWLFGEYNEQGERKGNILSKDLSNNIEKYFPDMAKGATVGGITAILPFVPGGPVAGIILGSAIGFAKNNEKISSYLFGNEEDEESGLLSKKRRDWLKQHVPEGIIGAGIGLITGGPFGLVGNMAVGAGIGLATQTDKFQDMLFGPVNEETGERQGGLIGILRDGFVKPLTEFGVNFATNARNWIKEDILDPIARAWQPMLKQGELALTALGRAIGGKIGELIAPKLGKSWTNIGQGIAERVKGVGRGVGKVAGVISRPARNMASAPFRLVGSIGDAFRRRQIQNGNADYMTAEERNTYRRELQDNVIYDKYDKDEFDEEGNLIHRKGEIKYDDYGSPIIKGKMPFKFLTRTLNGRGLNRRHGLGRVAHYPMATAGGALGIGGSVLGAAAGTAGDLLFHPFRTLRHPLRSFRYRTGKSANAIADQIGAATGDLFNVNPDQFEDFDKMLTEATPEELKAMSDSLRSLQDKDFARRKEDEAIRGINKIFDNTFADKIDFKYRDKIMRTLGDKRFSTAEKFRDASKQIDDLRAKEIIDEDTYFHLKNQFTQRFTDMEGYGIGATNSEKRRGKLYAELRKKGFTGINDDNLKKFQGLIDQELKVKNKMDINMFNDEQKKRHQDIVDLFNEAINAITHINDPEELAKIRTKRMQKNAHKSSKSGFMAGISGHLFGHTNGSIAKGEWTAKTEGGYTVTYEGVTYDVDINGVARDAEGNIVETGVYPENKKGQRKGVSGLLGTMGHGLNVGAGKLFKNAWTKQDRGLIREGLDKIGKRSMKNWVDKKTNRVEEEGLKPVKDAEGNIIAYEGKDENGNPFTVAKEQAEEEFSTLGDRTKKSFNKRLNKKRSKFERLINRHKKKAAKKKASYREEDDLNGILGIDDDYDGTKYNGMTDDERLEAKRKEVDEKFKKDSEKETRYVTDFLGNPVQWVKGRREQWMVAKSQSNKLTDKIQLGFVKPIDAIAQKVGDIGADLKESFERFFHIDEEDGWMKKILKIGGGVLGVLTVAGFMPILETYWDDKVKPAVKNFWDETIYPKIESYIAPIKPAIAKAAYGLDSAIAAIPLAINSMKDRVTRLITVDLPNIWGSKILPFYTHGYEWLSEKISNVVGFATQHILKYIPSVISGVGKGIVNFFSTDFKTLWNSPKGLSNSETYNIMDKAQESYDNQEITVKEDGDKSGLFSSLYSKVFKSSAYKDSGASEKGKSAYSRLTNSTKKYYTSDDADNITDYAYDDAMFSASGDYLGDYGDNNYGAEVEQSNSTSSSNKGLIGRIKGLFNYSGNTGYMNGWDNGTSENAGVNNDYVPTAAEANALITGQGSGLRNISGGSSYRVEDGLYIEDDGNIYLEDKVSNKVNSLKNAVVGGIKAPSASLNLNKVNIKGAISNTGSNISSGLNSTQEAISNAADEAKNNIEILSSQSVDGYVVSEAIDRGGNSYIEEGTPGFIGRDSSGINYFDPSFIPDCGITLVDAQVGNNCLVYDMNRQLIPNIFYDPDTGYFTNLPTIAAINYYASHVTPEYGGAADTIYSAHDRALKVAYTHAGIADRSIYKNAVLYNQEDSDGNFLKVSDRNANTSYQTNEISGWNPFGRSRTPGQALTKYMGKSILTGGKMPLSNTFYKWATKESIVDGVKNSRGLLGKARALTTGGIKKVAGWGGTIANASGEKLYSTDIMNRINNKLRGKAAHTMAAKYGFGNAQNMANALRENGAKAFANTAKEFNNKLVSDATKSVEQRIAAIAASGRDAGGLIANKSSMIEQQIAKTLEKDISKYATSKAAKETVEETAKAAAKGTVKEGEGFIEKLFSKCIDHLASSSQVTSSIENAAEAAGKKGIGKKLLNGLKSGSGKLAKAVAEKAGNILAKIGLKVGAGLSTAGIVTAVFVVGGFIDGFKDRTVADTFDMTIDVFNTLGPIKWVMKIISGILGAIEGGTGIPVTMIFDTFSDFIIKLFGIDAEEFEELKSKSLDEIWEYNSIFGTTYDNVEDYNGRNSLWNRFKRLIGADSASEEEKERNKKLAEQAKERDEYKEKIANQDAFMSQYVYDLVSRRGLFNKAVKIDKRRSSERISESSASKLQTNYIPEVYYSAYGSGLSAEGSGLTDLSTPSPYMRSGMGSALPVHKGRAISLGMSADIPSYMDYTGAGSSNTISIPFKITDMNGDVLNTENTYEDAMKYGKSLRGQKYNIIKDDNIVYSNDLATNKRLTKNSHMISRQQPSAKGSGLVNLSAFGSGLPIYYLSAGDTGTTDTTTTNAININKNASNYTTTGVISGINHDTDSRFASKISTATTSAKDDLSYEANVNVDNSRSKYMINDMIYCMMIMESSSNFAAANWDTATADGGYGLGILQWKGKEAIDLLYEIAKADPNAAKELLEDELYNMVYTKRKIDVSQPATRNAITKLLVSDAGKTTQINKAKAYAEKLYNRGKKVWKNPKVVLFWSIIYAFSQDVGESLIRDNTFVERISLNKFFDVFSINYSDMYEEDKTRYLKAFNLAMKTPIDKLNSKFDETSLRNMISDSYDEEEEKDDWLQSLWDSIKNMGLAWFGLAKKKGIEATNVDPSAYNSISTDLDPNNAVDGFTVDDIKEYLEIISDYNKYTLKTRLKAIKDAFKVDQNTTLMVMSQPYGDTGRSISDLFWEKLDGTTLYNEYTEVSNSMGSDINYSELAKVYKKKGFIDSIREDFNSIIDNMENINTIKSAAIGADSSSDISEANAVANELYDTFYKNFIAFGTKKNTDWLVYRSPNPINYKGAFNNAFVKNVLANNQDFVAMIQRGKNRTEIINILDEYSEQFYQDLMAGKFNSASDMLMEKLDYTYSVLADKSAADNAKERVWDEAQAILQSMDPSERGEAITDLGKKYKVSDFNYMLSNNVAKSLFGNTRTQESLQSWSMRTGTPIDKDGKAYKKYQEYINGNKITAGYNPYTIKKSLESRKMDKIMTNLNNEFSKYHAYAANEKGERVGLYSTSGKLSLNWPESFGVSSEAIFGVRSGLDESKSDLANQIYDILENPTKGLKITSGGEEYAVYDKEVHNGNNTADTKQYNEIINNTDTIPSSFMKYYDYYRKKKYAGNFIGNQDVNWNELMHARARLEAYQAYQQLAQSGQQLTDAEGNERPNNVTEESVLLAKQEYEKQYKLAQALLEDSIDRSSLDADNKAGEQIERYLQRNYSKGYSLDTFHATQARNRLKDATAARIQAVNNYEDSKHWWKQDGDDEKKAILDKKNEDFQNALKEVQKYNKMLTDNDKIVTSQIGETIVNNNKYEASVNNDNLYLSKHFELFDPENPLGSANYAENTDGYDSSERDWIHSYNIYTGNNNTEANSDYQEDNKVKQLLSTSSTNPYYSEYLSKDTPTLDVVQRLVDGTATEAEYAAWGDYCRKKGIRTEPIKSDPDQNGAELDRESGTSMDNHLVGYTNTKNRNIRRSKSGGIHDGSGGKFGDSSNPSFSSSKNATDIARSSFTAKGSGFVSQLDYGNAQFNDGTSLVQAGCGPAVAAMAINNLKRRSAGSSNLAMATAAYANKYKDGGGTKASYFQDIMSKAGANTSYTNSTSSIKSSLRKGDQVVLMGQDSSNKSKANSPFGPNNHYVLATGMGHGKIAVSDPEQRGPVTYSDKILNNTKLGVAISGRGSGINTILSTNLSAGDTSMQNHKVGTSSISNSARNNDKATSKKSKFIGPIQQKKNKKKKKSASKITGGVLFNVPEGCGTAMTYQASDGMGYKAGKVIKLSTTTEEGLRHIDGRFCISLTPYLASGGKITYRGIDGTEKFTNQDYINGTYFDAYLSDGTIIPGVVCDIKGHDNDKGGNSDWGHDNGASLLEFVYKKGAAAKGINPGTSSWRKRFPNSEYNVWIGSNGRPKKVVKVVVSSKDCLSYKMDGNTRIDPTIQGTAITATGDSTTTTGDSANSSNSSSSENSTWLEKIIGGLTKMGEAFYGNSEKNGATNLSTNSTDGGYSANYSADGSWISTVKAVKEAMATNSGRYSQSGSVNININGKKMSVRTDCSGFVSACCNVYTNGKFPLNQNSSDFQASSKLKACGFKHYKFTSWDNLSEGDILATQGHGHVEIFSHNKNGIHYVYNYGGEKSAPVKGVSGSGHSSYGHVWRPPSSSATGSGLLDLYTAAGSSLDLFNNLAGFGTEEIGDEAEIEQFIQLDNESAKGTGLIDDIIGMGTLSDIVNNTTSTSNSKANKGINSYVQSKGLSSTGRTASGSATTSTASKKNARFLDDIMRTSTTNNSNSNSSSTNNYNTNNTTSASGSGIKSHVDTKHSTMTQIIKKASKNVGSAVNVSSGNKDIDTLLYAIVTLMANEVNNTSDIAEIIKLLKEIVNNQKDSKKKSSTSSKSSKTKSATAKPSRKKKSAKGADLGEDFENEIEIRENINNFARSMANGSKGEQSNQGLQELMNSLSQIVSK